MPQAITFNNFKVHCDTCHHEISCAPDAVHEWHGKPCPECGAPDIIDDGDMDQFRALRGFVGFVNKAFGDMPQGHSAAVRFDSAAAKRGSS